ncbi:MAG: acyloxyacyl hydrolase [Legionellales bacterium]|nr:acyloxyacyl hydrolase [Legionellales bacterium]
MTFKWNIAIGLMTLILSLTTYASGIDSASLSIGAGNPAHLRGARIAVQKLWNLQLFPSDGWSIGGYWDANLAYWHTKGDSNGRYKSISIIGLNPVFRLQPNHNVLWTLRPYFEASVGIAALSAKNLANRGLGANWSFEDLLGLGVRFGQHQQYDVSLHYLHYSNAGIKPPNNGIDVKYLLTLRYYFNS